MRFQFIFLTLIVTMKERQGFAESGLRYENPQPKVVVPPVCPPIGEFYVPHPNCSLYYRCDDGILFELRCADTLYWKQEIEECTFPSEVPECQGGTRDPTSPTIPTEEPPEPTQEVTTEEPIITTKNPATSNPPEITTESEPGPICKDGGIYFVPYPGNCSLYYICAHGEAVVESCWDGLSFDPIELQCVPEEDSSCLESTPHPTTDLPRTTEEIPTTTLAPICPEDGIYFVPFSGNCSLYYICADRVPQIAKCSEYLSFDPIELKCVPEEESTCVDSTLPAGSTTTHEPVQTTDSPVDPTSDYPDEPTSDYPDEPTSDYPVEPTSDYPDEPTSDYPVEPTSDYPDEPTSDYPVEPTSDYPDEPTSDYPVEPTSDYPDEPTSDYPVEPTSDYPDEPTSDYPVEPTSDYPDEPTSDYPVEPTSDYPDEPTSDYPVEPTSDYPDEPTSDYPVEHTSEATVESTTGGDVSFPCPPEGDDYLAHPVYCHLFYVCSEGELIGVYSCGEYWFDSRSSSCVPPANSDCPYETRRP